METLVIHPETKEQLAALKAFNDVFPLKEAQDIIDDREYNFEVLLERPNQ